MPPRGPTAPLFRPPPGPAAAADPGEHERQFLLLRAARMVREGRLSYLDLLVDGGAPDPEITAIVPARNEEATIEQVVAECRRYAGEVLVIDGRSSDATAARAAAAGARVLHDSGRGKGAALREAVAAVRSPICVFIDADGSHDPIDIPLLVGPIKAGHADHVTGSRLLGGSSELHGGGDEFLRLAGSAFITFLINWRFSVRISDSQNGFRAIRTAVFRRLTLRSQHQTIEMEMVMATLAAGYRLAEVPTHERPRTAGFSKISLARPSVWFGFGWALLLGLCRRRTPAAPAP